MNPFYIKFLLLNERARDKRKMSSEIIHAKCKVIMIRVLNRREVLFKRNHFCKLESTAVKCAPTSME